MTSIYEVVEPDFTVVTEVSFDSGLPWNDAIQVNGRTAIYDEKCNAFILCVQPICPVCGDQPCGSPSACRSYARSEEGC